MGTLLSLVLASENRNKQNEFQRAFGSSVKLLNLHEIKFSQSLPLESGSSYEENAAIKAMFVGRELGLATLSDDSGFEVSALGGEPGIHSARFLGGADSKLQCQEILKRLERADDRSARFVCVLALYSPTSDAVSFFRGQVEGVVSHSLRGSEGFGYDPIFIPSGSTKTFAEMNGSEKWAISHRGQAVQRIKEALSL